MMYRCLRLVVCLAVVAALAACAQTRALVHPDVAGPGAEAATVLLMPPDVEIVELTAAGMQEPRADWTEAGRRNLRRALGDVLAGHGARLVDYRPAADPVQVVRDEHLQLVKLHQAVGRTILVHRYAGGGRALPTKDGRFDWTLGPGVARLRDDSEADYALFVFFRDSFSSPGRKALMVAGALLGIGVRGGQQLGFASLVDLETGRIAWFNLMQSATGDLRQPEGARNAGEALLAELPL